MKIYLMSLVVVLLVLAALFDITVADTPPQPVVKTVTMEFSSPNREYVYILSTGYTSKRAEFGEMLYELVKTAPAKDVIHFFEADTYLHKHIFTAEIPDVDDELLRDIDYPMQRAQVEAVKLLEYAPPDVPKQLTPAEMIDAQQISLLRLGATVKSVRQTTFPLCVVLAGSPIFNGEKVHRGFTMEHGDIPGRATLKKDQQHLSPFVDGVVDLPANTLVTILSDTGFGIDHIHEEKVQQFWEEFLSERGGAHLLRITDSVASAFRVRDAQITEPPKPNETDTELEGEFGVYPSTMHSVLDNEGDVPTIVYFGLSDKKRPIYEPTPPNPQSVAGAIEEALASQSHTLFALSYQMDRTDWTYTDTDFYAFSSITPEVLSYKNRSTPFGKLLGDVRYGEVTIRGGNVEMMLLKNEELSNLEVYANVHVAVGPIDCLVRSFGNGITKEYTFTIPSIYGDEGENEFRKEQHASWYKLPLPHRRQQLPNPSQGAANKDNISASGMEFVDKLQGAFSTLVRECMNNSLALSRAVGRACSSVNDWLSKASISIASRTAALQGEASQRAVFKKPLVSNSQSSQLSHTPLLPLSQETVPVAPRPARLPSSNTLAQSRAPVSTPPVEVAQRSIVVPTQTTRFSSIHHTTLLPTISSSPVENKVPGHPYPYYWDSEDCVCY